jgi:3-dehydroquinate dehydratase-2
MRRVLVINGPNLNMLGIRDTEMYGSGTLDDLVALCRSWGEDVGIEVRAFQSNHEGAIIDVLHDARDAFDGVVINPGAYAHTSYAIRDAIDAIGIPVIEVHISNVMEREAWRRASVTAPACTGTIYGRGVEGYRWAIRKLWFDHRVPPDIVAYGDAADQTGDLRVPGPGRPLVVLVHGGFWRRPWTRDLMDGLAVDLFDLGLATLNIEYRRIGSGGGWPTSADDVVAALGWSSDRFERTILIGHSAGGHLALAAALRFPVDLVISLAGVTDLAAAVADNLGDGAAEAFLNGADRAAASPLEMLPLARRQLIVHGTDDETVPVSYARRYVDAARTAGDSAELLELPDVGHMELIDERSHAWRVVADRMAGLL